MKIEKQPLLQQTYLTDKWNTNQIDIQNKTESQHNDSNMWDANKKQQIFDMAHDIKINKTQRIQEEQLNQKRLLEQITQQNELEVKKYIRHKQISVQRDFTILQEQLSKNMEKHIEKQNIYVQNFIEIQKQSYFGEKQESDWELQLSQKQKVTINVLHMFDEVHQKIVEYIKDCPKKVLQKKFKEAEILHVRLESVIQKHNQEINKLAQKLKLPSITKEQSINNFQTFIDQQEESLLNQIQRILEGSVAMIEEKLQVNQQLFYIKMIAQIKQDLKVNYKFDSKKFIEEQFQNLDLDKSEKKKNIQQIKQIEYDEDSLIKYEFYKQRKEDRQPADHLNFVYGETYKTRADQFKEFDNFPLNSDRRFIIKSNQTGYGFKSSSYDPVLLQSHISHQRFKYIIMQCNNIVKDQYMLEKLEESKKHSVALQDLTLLAVYILIFAILLLFISQFFIELSTYQNLTLIFLSQFSFLIAALIFGKIAHYSYVDNPEFNTFDSKCEIALNDLLWDINNQFIRDNVKLSFKIPKKFFWLELITDETHPFQHPFKEKPQKNE